MPTARNRNYNLVVRAQGEGDLKKLQTQLNRTNRQLNTLNKTSKNLAIGFSGLQSGLIGFISALSVREIARFSDEIQLLDNRLAVFADEGQSSIELLNGLNEVAKITRGDLIALGESYNRIAINVKDLGLTSKETLDITQALNQTFRLSGSSIAEARGATIQFTQGLAQAELRGQELRSVLEANAVFGGLLAQKLGVTRGELLKLGEAGKITSEVALGALLDNFDELNEKAEGLLPTFEQGFIRLVNEARLSINLLNKELKLSATFANAMEDLGNNIGAVFGALSGAAVVAAIGSIGLLVTAVGGVAAAAAGATVAVSALIGSIIQQNAEEKEIIENGKESEKLILRQNKLIAERNRILNNSVRVDTFRAKDLGEEIDLLDRQIAQQLKREAVEEQNAIRSEKTSKRKERELKGLEKLNNEYDRGAISLARYRQEVLALDLNKLEEQYTKGKVGFDEFQKSVEKTIEDFNKLEKASRDSTFGDAINDGIEEYTKSVGTFSENVSGAITNAFSGAEDALTDFVVNGKASFKDFTNAILEDLARIAIRQAIVRPIAQSFLGSADGNIFSGGQVVPSANGNVFSGGNVQAFATGGVVQSPTYFPMPGSQTGLMGEAGPEAIVPLDRVNGKLGINAKGLGGSLQVNIINQAGADVEASERQDSSGQRILDVMIRKKVSEGFASGTFDKTMNSRYGLRPRGN